jgi:hypothetical protein
MSGDVIALLTAAVLAVALLCAERVGVLHRMQTFRPPANANAARYVSVTEDVVTTLRNSFLSQPGDDQ